VAATSLAYYNWKKKIMHKEKTTRSEAPRTTIPHQDLQM
jgi:hypothetical protein